MKSKFLSFIICLFAISSFSQSPTFEWATAVEFSVSGYPSSICEALELDEQNNIITTGSFSGIADFNPGNATLNSNGVIAGYIQKQNADGDFLWAIKIGSTSQSAPATALALDGDGNIYVTGYFFNTVDFDSGAGVSNLTAVGSMDTYILKLNADGGFIWVKQLGGAGNQLSESIAVDQNGNVSVVGVFSQTTDFDPGVGEFNLTATSFADMYVVKLNVNGDFLWSKQVGHNDLDLGMEVFPVHTLDVDGNIVITGTYYFTIDVDPGPEVLNFTAIGYLNTFILKLDLDGTLIWAKNIGLTSPDAGVVSCRDVKVDDDNNIVVVGEYGGSADMNPGPALLQYISIGYDVLVLKLDSEGNFIWVSTATGLGDGLALALTISSNGDCYVTGYFEDTVDFDDGPNTANLLASGNLSNPDVFVLKLHSDGDYAWAFKIGTVYNDYGVAIAVDENENVYTFGKYYNNPTAFSYPEIDFDPGDGTYYLPSNSENPRGFFVQKVSQCTPSVYNDVQVACDSFTWSNGVTYTAPNNSATQTLVSATGCDSIVNLFLTLNVSSFFTANQSACDAFTWPLNGATYTSSGTYTFEETNAGGCPQITTLNLTIDDIDASTTLSGVTLTANATGADYQWINCNNNTPVPNQTSQTFTPTASGNYAVIVSENGCEETSDCVSVIVSGVDEIVNSSIDIYPNPSNDAVTITSSSNIEKIELMNALGQVVQVFESLHINKYSFQLPKESGAYFVRIYTEKGTVNRRVVRGG